MAMPRTCKGLREAAAFLPGLMTRGTKKLTYQQLRDELTRLDVQIGCRAAAGDGAALSFGAAPSAVDAAGGPRPVAADLREPGSTRRNWRSIKAQAQSPDVRAIADRSAGRWPRSCSRARSVPIRPTTFAQPDRPTKRLPRLKPSRSTRCASSISEYPGRRPTANSIVIGDFDPEPTLKPKSTKCSPTGSRSSPMPASSKQAFLDVPGGKHSILTPDKANASLRGRLMHRAERPRSRLCRR